MTKLEVYKHAIDDAMFVLSTLHGYNKDGLFYDKSIKDALMELRESADCRIGKEECNNLQTLKEFKDSFEKLFKKMKEQVGVISITIKEVEEYRNSFAPLVKDKVIKFDINIENG